MTRPRIRPLDVVHLRAVAALEGAVFDRPWSEKSLREVWQNRHAPELCRGAWIAQDVVGYVVSAWTGDRVEIYRLAVRQDHRRGGVAGLLVADVLAAANVLGASGVDLEVGADNPSAVAFYLAAGFREVGLRPCYYPTPDGPIDAHLLSVELGD